jgi:drug/metabolite transporter (DMT)-like permease
MRISGERATLTAFVLGAALAGGNAVAVRFSNRELDPLWAAGLRFALAAAVFLGIVGMLRIALPRGRALAGAVLFGLVQFAATFALVYYAFLELHAGFGQIIFALVPLLAVLLAAIQGEEKLRLVALVGALLALAGVALMSSTELRTSVPLLSVLAALGGALCFAESAVLVRIVPPVHPVAMNAVGMSAGAAALLAGAAATGESLVLPEGEATLVASVYLVTLGSVGVFFLYLFVLGRWTASRAAYSFLLSPIVSVALSAWLDDEPVGWGLVLGGLLVLCGVYVGALRAPPTSARVTE